MTLSSSYARSPYKRWSSNPSYSSLTRKDFVLLAPRCTPSEGYLSTHFCETLEDFWELSSFMVDCCLIGPSCCTRGVKFSSHRRSRQPHYGGRTLPLLLLLLSNNIALTLFFFTPSARHSNTNNTECFQCGIRSCLA